MSREMSVVEVRPRGIAAVRVATELARWPGQVGATLDKVYAAVRAGQIRQSGRNVMIYHLHDGVRADIECGVETPGRFEPVGEIVYCETPAGRAATTLHVGPYEELPAAHGELMVWSRQNGHRFAGMSWEIYGDWDEDPAKLRTDIFHLLVA